jgi:branched-chain amino acid transport system substrate-binding protein
MKGNKGAKGVTRRDFLKATAAGAAGLSIGSLAPFSKAWGQKPIKIGFVSIFSGRMAMLGETGYNGFIMAVDEINAKGGLLGKKMEVIRRDSAGKIEDAVRIVRDFVAKDKVDVIFDQSSSREAFAIREVTKDLKMLTFVTASETAELTGNPKGWSPFSFRTGDHDVHNSVVAGIYAAQIAKANKWVKWGSISPDYAYGRDFTDAFFTILQMKYPEVKVVTQMWPKLFEPDYTSHITAALNAKPDAMFSAFWGGDLATFLEQAQMFGFFDQVKFFGNGLADYSVLKAVKKVPAGLYTGSRYLRNVPDTKENQEFCDKYQKKFGDLPTHWSQECYTGVLFMEAAAKKAGTLETEPMIKALEGLTIKAPWGSPPKGTITMRAKDHTPIHYAEAWGMTIANPPYVKDIQYIDWDTILQHEELIYKKRGWI